MTYAVERRLAKSWLFWATKMREASDLTTGNGLWESLGGPVSALPRELMSCCFNLLQNTHGYLPWANALSREGNKPVAWYHLRHDIGISLMLNLATIRKWQGPTSHLRVACAYRKGRKSWLTVFTIFLISHSTDFATAECVCLSSSPKLRFSIHHSRRFWSSFVKGRCGQRQVLESVAQGGDSTTVHWRSFCVHGGWQ